MMHSFSQHSEAYGIAFKQETDTDQKARMREGDKVEKYAENDTHIVFGLLVGTGIDQQPRTVRVTIRGGIIQRRPSALRISNRYRSKLSKTFSHIKCKCYKYAGSTKPQIQN